LETWTNTVEIQLVAAKKDVSQVRNEATTAGYGLVNLRSSYLWKKLRVDFDIENLFDRFYSMPLGGAYVGQGSSMTSNGVPWGITVPGRGRSFNIALNLSF
jgi:iron complex outermembrane receptor protein